MVIHAFPAAKLGALLMKQISKPIANFIKERAKGHPFFRKYVCMPPAHFYNWCEVRMKMWILHLGKPVTIPPLNEAMAIDLGANILGEGIIFVVAAVLLFMEYSRQVRKEEKKEAARKEELGTLNYTIQELYFQIERQDAQIRQLYRNVTELESQVVRKPWAGKPETPPPETELHPPPCSEKPKHETVVPVVNIFPGQIPQEFLHSITDIKHQSHQYHHHLHHRDVIPMQLEQINKVVADNPGVVLSAVAYLTNDIFNLKNEYYTEIHLQQQY